MEKLSSGFRINRAGDDAAGLAISEKMRAQVRGLKQASRNAQDGISLIQTAEGALNETHAILQRMRELAVQSATDTNTDDDRLEIQKEIHQLSEEITRISTDTEFNTQKLLNGNYADKVFHIGANENQKVELKIESMGADDLNVHQKAAEAIAAKGVMQDIEIVSEDETNYKINFVAATSAGVGTTAVVSGKTITVTLGTSALSTGDDPDDFVVNAVLDDVVSALNVLDEIESAAVVSGVTGETKAAVAGDGKLEGGMKALLEDPTKGINVSTQTAANEAITVIDDAIVQVSAERSKLGALQNRLEHTIANLGTSAENLQAAESRIRDLDMAEEIMAFTKNNILQQAATAMLAQANMAPQSVLQLLG